MLLAETSVLGCSGGCVAVTLSCLVCLPLWEVLSVCRCECQGLIEVSVGLVLGEHVGRVFGMAAFGRLLSVPWRRSVPRPVLPWLALEIAAAPVMKWCEQFPHQ